MELTIEPASDDVYGRLRELRYPPPYDFQGAATHGYSRLPVKRL
jgi:hypothetical protein